MPDSKKPEEMPNFGAVVEMLKASDPEFREQLLERIAQEFPEFAEALKKSVFVFEDIAKFGQKTLSALISKIPWNTFALAMRGTNEAFRHKIFSSMSERRAENLRDELKNGAPRKMSDVREAREQVCAIIQQLSLEPRDDDPLV